MIYYWIVSQHSGKVLDVIDCSVSGVIQNTKKSENDPTVDSQLWYFNGGFIINKYDGLVLDVHGAKFQNGTYIIQYPRWFDRTFKVKIRAQEWDYDCEDNTIKLRYDKSYVLDIKDESKENSARIILNKEIGSPSQKFILQKWNDVSEANSERLITNIINKNKFLPKLSQNLLEMLDDDKYYDINIEVGNDPYVKIFHAHTNILYYRSSHFRRILSASEKKYDGTLLHIKLPNILPETFQIILRYIYGGRFSLKEYDTSDIIKILIAASELGLQELIPYLESFLIENKTSWMEQNFNLIYQTSFENDSFLELQKYCTDLISKEPDKIFKLTDFSSISEKLLVALIQNDDNLQMSDIQIWEHVLKWGISQNLELPSDPASFSKNDFNTLKGTLQQCIPFIKFQHLTSKEFLEKVLPYKKILPKELYKNLLSKFLDNDNKIIKDSESVENEKSKKINSNNIINNINSKIITFQHVELISKWINRLEITDNLTSLYEFKLLFRGSRDGFYPEKFHEICDNQSQTVTVVKVKGSNEILGGYNPIEWKSGDTWDTTNDSFIFSFNRVENYILSRVINKNKAIYNGSYCGPSFGSGDLIIWGLDSNTFCNYCSSSKTTFYEKLIRETEGRFSVEECEVFQLILKFSKE